MSTVTVAPPFSFLADPSDARKRRREILASQRVNEPDAVATSPSPPLLKKLKTGIVVSSDDETVSSSSESPVIKKKKSQMKYEPDQPMSKEEATAWRREERRKRNRESAAASRQRQRDRITELENELAMYKKHYEAVQAQIRAMKSNIGAPCTESPDRTIHFQRPSADQASCSGVVLSDMITIIIDETRQPAKITIPAVKISGEEEKESIKVPGDMEQLLPDPVISVPTVGEGLMADIDTEELLQVLDPLDSSLFFIKDDENDSIVLPPLEDEFSEFLLDAVDWL